MIANEGVLAFAEETGSLRAVSEALMSRGIFLIEDDPVAAMEAEFESAEAARRAGSRPTEVIALTNAVEAAVDLGRWRDAEEALATVGAMEVSGTLADGIDLSTALLAAFRGNFAEADDRLEATTAKGSDHLAARTWYLRTRAMVELLRGDLDGAYTLGMEAIHADPAGMNTPNAVWDAARAALWMRDAARVQAAIDATAPLRGRWAAAIRTTLRAGLAAIEGRREESASAYQEALTEWDAMGCPIDHAYTAIDAITLLPNEPVAIEAAAQARARLEELGAKPLLERLAMAEHPAPADAS